MNNTVPHLTAAIFDLDGTLLDSMEVWQQVDIEFLARRGIPMPKDYSAALAPMSFPQAADYTKRRFSLPDTEDAIMREWHAMAEDAYAHRIVCKPHVKDYLRSLSARGIGIAAATASQRAFYQPALMRNGIWDCFSSVTESAEVARGTGFPDIYLRAAEKLGVSPASCAVFEDIAPGLRGARDGGFFTVGVFDPHTADQEEILALSRRYIRDFGELLAQDIFF